MVWSTFIDRFEAKFIPEPMSGCWLWIGATDENGYGRFGDWQDGRTRMFLPHRISYELHVGPIPDGLVLDHLCRTPSCVNPDHLDPVRQRVNVLRGNVGKKLERTHCSKGHEFTSENTAWVARGSGKSRRCRQCHAANAMKSYNKIGRQTRMDRKAA
jgi:hypothetical protein